MPQIISSQFKINWYFRLAQSEPEKSTDSSSLLRLTDVTDHQLAYAKNNGSALPYWSNPNIKINGFFTAPSADVTDHQFPNLQSMVLIAILSQS